MNRLFKSIKSSKVLLADFSTIGIGEVSRVFFPKNALEIIDIYKNCKDPFPIGGGSNTLFSDVSKRLFFSDRDLPKRVDIDGRRVVVSSNTTISELGKILVKKGLGGLEFLMGIPAHLGGLVKMNASAYGYSISDFIEFVEIVDKRGVCRRKTNKFVYRGSDIDGFILSVALKLKKSSKDEVQSFTNETIKKRLARQPLKKMSIGCIFKNPQNTSAGYLLEKCGLKGKSFGDVAISKQHANFFVNRGKASFEDMTKLIDYAQNRVYQRFNIELELEIKIA